MDLLSIPMNIIKLKNLEMMLFWEQWLWKYASESIKYRLWYGYYMLYGRWNSRKLLLKKTGFDNETLLNQYLDDSLYNLAVK